MRTMCTPRRARGNGSPRHASLLCKRRARAPRPSPRQPRTLSPTLPKAGAGETDEGFGAPPERGGYFLAAKRGEVPHTEARRGRNLNGPGPLPRALALQTHTAPGGTWASPESGAVSLPSLPH